MVLKLVSSIPRILVVLTAGAATPAHAGMESDWSAPAGTAVRLIAGAKDGAALTGGIEIRLAPGWKTYWRYPGDSGIPPRFDWSGSENLGSIALSWPVPQRFGDGDGNFSIGYKSDVILPVRIEPKDATRPVKLRLDLEFAVCEKICQPAHAALTLDVPAGGAAPTPDALTEAEAALPGRAALGDDGAIGIDKAKLEADHGGKAIRIEARVAGTDGVDLFVEGPNGDWALPLPALKRLEDGRAEFLMQIDGVPKGADISRVPLRFTLVDGKRAIEVETPLSAP
ncbi:MAG: hypothetical protein K0R27_1696 [Xanthobacteraceae bacterium]|jgi:DsbC/DsbD-like thiol-disulfide interchange protein|nr:hypothetical protein [Xanthobacteraceae bacterium]